MMVFFYNPTFFFQDNVKHLMLCGLIRFFVSVSSFLGLGFGILHLFRFSGSSAYRFMGMLWMLRFCEFFCGVLHGFCHAELPESPLECWVCRLDNPSSPVALSALSIPSLLKRL